MLSSMTKLHLILIFTVVAVALYMYFLYKEIKDFQADVQNIKKQVHEIITKQGGNSAVCELPIAPKPQTNVPVTQTDVVASATIEVSTNIVDTDSGNEDVISECDPQEAVEENIITTNEDDDNISVTSNEIKDILTNIQDVDESELSDQRPPDVIVGERKTLPDMASMSIEELNALKYDDLRNYLRKHGVHMKGTKQELITKIKSL